LEYTTAGWVCIAGEPTEPERGDDRCGLRHTDPRPLRQLLGSGAGKLREAAVLGQQRRGEVECSLPAPPVPKDEREQLSLAHGLDAASEQPLTQALVD
jgi:hypothetical protein